MATKGQKHFGEKIIFQVLEMKEQGLSNREISEHFGFKDKFVIKHLIKRYNKKQKKIKLGIIIRPKGRPRKITELDLEQNKDNQIKQLRMENELLRSFLQTVGRR